MVHKILYFLFFFIVSCSLSKRLERKSTSIGKVSSGQLKNGCKLPYLKSNYRYFSPLSYLVLNRKYVHNDVAKTLIATYKALEQEYPKYVWRYMECTKKKGGKLKGHRTHQNGLSVDFMSPMLTKKGNKTFLLNKMGLWHYLLKFNEKGDWSFNKNISIDFNMMANHIIHLQRNALKNKLRIKKVILKINLKDDLFATSYGKELKRLPIYFVQKLSYKINEQHDDHYHIDFEKI